MRSFCSITPLFNVTHNSLLCPAQVINQYNPFVTSSFKSHFNIRRSFEITPRLYSYPVPAVGHTSLNRQVTVPCKLSKISFRKWTFFSTRRYAQSARAPLSHTSIARGYRDVVMSITQSAWSCGNLLVLARRSPSTVPTVVIYAI